jgi:hypothetical protein
MKALKEISTWKKNIPRATHHNSVTERGDNE